MKKNIFLLLMFLLSIFANAAEPAIILELTGDVQIKPAGSAVFINAKEGDEIAINTIISTGFRSTAVITAGYSVITVRPLTRLSLEENLSINMQTGRIKVETQTKISCSVSGNEAKSGSLVVKSQSTAALTQGTSFEFDTVNIKVNEGRILFSGESGPAAIVRANEEYFIGADGLPAVKSSLLSLLVSGSSRDSSSGSQQSGGGGGSCCD